MIRHVNTGCNSNFCTYWDLCCFERTYYWKEIQGGSNMTGTDLYVNKPHCAAAVRP